MASLTKLPRSVSQTTGGNYRTFSDLANIKVIGSGLYATSSGNILGKNSSPNRPSTVSCSNFGFNLPTGAEVSKVTVQYNHRKSSSGLSIGAPTVTLLGVSGKSGKGVAPTTRFVESSKSFTGLTRTQVNSSSFGVKLDYPANTSSGTGTVSIGYVRIIVSYKVPSYSLTLKKVSGGYNEESYTVEASISNTNLTGYNPSCTLTAPTGFSFTDFSGSGEYTRVSPTTISWNPKFSSKVASSTASFKFDVDVTYPSGQSSYTGTFTLSESLYSGSKSLSATITDRPRGTGEDVDPDAPPIITDDDNTPIPINWVKCKVNEEITSYLSGIHETLEYFAFPCTKDGELIFNQQNSIIQYQGGPNYWATITRYFDGEYVSRYHTANYDWKIRCGGTGLQRLMGFRSLEDRSDPMVDITPPYSKYENETPILNIFIEGIPDEEDLSTPFFTILEPSEEEMNRLGSGYTYIAQSDINHTTTDENIRDWYKNNRIGVFNNEAPLFIDEGTTASHNDNWYNQNSSFTRTRTDTGTNLKITSPSGNQAYFAGGSGTWGSTKIYTAPFNVEFEITEIKTGTPNFEIRGDNTYFTWTCSQVGSYRIEITGTKVRKYFNGAIEGSEYDRTMNEVYAIGFRQNASTEFKYKNFKIVSNNPNQQEIFSTAKYWGKETAGLNEYNSVECEFTYDEDYPLYLIITGDYPEATSYGYDMGSIKYDTPCIIEKQVYNGRERNGTYPTPIEALLSGEDIATLELASNQTSQGAVLYSFPVDETISTNDKLAIRGLQVRANIEATDNLVIQAKLHSPTGEVGNRSILVDSQDKEIVIGGLGDLWGFTTLQMTQLELWQLELSVANILSQSDSSILFNNVEIIFYLETVEKQEITIRVEDEDIAYYGAFIETVKIPEGLNTDTSFLSIDGTDTNDAYRQNIREKTITIEFNLSNCELQTSTDMLRQLTKLFVNEKDQYNRPIPKRIQFSHYPNDYFEYIMEEPFDVDTDITDYTIKAQLTVPSGTSYSLYDTVTNTTGNANGLAAVNPIITVRPSDVNIQVSESNSGQVFQIAYTGDWNDHTVEIDCEDRKVYLIKGEDERIDISKYADYNSDWFRLDGEYEFSSVNCTILSVIFNERW